MNCSKCNLPLEKGMLTGDSRHWIYDDSVIGKINKMPIMTPGMGKPAVWAWRCTQCKKIEFTSD